MEGICGAIDLEYASHIQQSAIAGMMDRIRHRGENVREVHVTPNIAMGFVTSSIIKYENEGYPLVNEDGTIYLICNGKIFNYKELKLELIEKGHVFRSDLDVEVIIHLYEEYGNVFMDCLNGQFAFVLVNVKERIIICARDHFGICPFYYTFIDDVFVFASEIKSIFCYPDVEMRVDLVGLDQIMTFPGLVSPRTMFKDVKSLENGHCLVIHENRVNNIEYWDLQYPEEAEIEPLRKESEYIDDLFSLLETAVSIRLRSDVPMGAYLSGGLDSSIIASMIAKLRNNHKFSTFSIAFNDKYKSEAYYQRLMAKELGTKHHEILYDSYDIIKRLQRAVYHSECPLKETYNTANMALSECAAEQGVKVILSGEGSDELFAGYIGYKFDKFRQEARRNNTFAERPGRLNELLWDDSFFVYERDLDLYTDSKLGLFSRSVKEIYHQVDSCNNFVINKKRIMNRHPVHKRAYIDYKLRLVDHLVCDHGDKMSFANAVETRYPFLDKNLFEYVSKIPPGLLLNDYQEKYIIKKCVVKKRLLPEEITEREKFEFCSHGSKELLLKNNPLINSVLDYDRLKEQGVFDPERILELKRKYTHKDFKLNVPHENDLLLIVITFGLFLESYGIKKVI